METLKKVGARASRARATTFLGLHVPSEYLIDPKLIPDVPSRFIYRGDRNWCIADWGFGKLHNSLKNKRGKRLSGKDARLNTFLGVYYLF